MKEKLNTQQNPKIKILIAYHKPAVLLKDEILTPIHLGRALATQASKDGTMSEEDYTWMCENMIGDDTGENISHLNRYLNELTGIYWAWKNYDKLDNPDFIGFMHYRRVFDFSEDEKSKRLEAHAFFNCPKLSTWSHRIQDDLLNSKDILNVLQTNFYIISQGCNINPYKQFAKEHNIEDYDLALSILDEKFPEFSQAAKVYNEGDTSYFCNMFVLPREEFFRYCEFIFGIVLEAFEQIKLKLGEKSFLENRVCAFFSERLTAIYFINLKLNHKNFKELPFVYIENTNTLVSELSSSNKNAIQICFGVEESYALSLCVTLQSLIQNTNKTKLCEIYILYFYLSEDFKEKLKYYENEYLKINFVDVNPYLYLYDLDLEIFYESEYIQKETYLKLFIPRIFKNYETILYLDSDIIVEQDVSELFNEILNNSLIAAAQDIGLYINYHYSQKFKFDKKEISYPFYLQEKLKLKYPEKYFNAGILLFNIKACLKIDFIQKASYILKEIPNLKYHDQDILNMLCNENFKSLDRAWNAQVCIVNDRKIPDIVPLNFLKDYKQIFSHAKILHFAGGYKPWAHPHLAKAPIWWSYARKTPFYEEILFNNIHHHHHHHNYTHYSLYGANERFKNQLSYKIGAEILSLKKNPLKIFILPLTLPFLIWQHKKDRKLYASITRVNQGLKLPLLEHYSDYTEGLKVKEHLSYRLGQALLKNPLTFVFKVKGIYKKWRKDKGE